MAKELNKEYIFVCKYNISLLKFSSSSISIFFIIKNYICTPVFYFCYILVSPVCPSWAAQSIHLLLLLFFDNIIHICQIHHEREKVAGIKAWCNDGQEQDNRLRYWELAQNRPSRHGRERAVRCIDRLSVTAAV